MTDTTALGMEDEAATGCEQGAGEDAETDPRPRTRQSGAQTADTSVSARSDPFRTSDPCF